MTPATVSMPDDLFDEDFELPGHQRRRPGPGPQRQVVRGAEPVSYIGPDRETTPRTIAPGEAINALAPFGKLTHAIPDCPVCGAAPRPHQVAGIGTHAITVYLPCQHQIDIEKGESARQIRVDGAKVAAKVFGEWPPPRRLRAITMADMKDRLGDSDDYAGTTAGLTVARFYLDNFPEMLAGGCGILMHGGPGTGKSLLSAAIANEVAAQGYYTAWVKIKGVYERLIGPNANRVGVLDALQRVDLLVLDELVSEKDTPAMLREFMRLVDDRYETGKPTIITSNFTIEQITDHFDAVLSRESGQDMGAMMVERFLSRMCPPRYRTVRFRGPDMRLRLSTSWGPDLAPCDE